MSEPITPKAEHHVVEGDYIEAETDSLGTESKNESPQAHQVNQKSKLKTNPKTNRTSSWLWLAVMLISGAAFALALSTWLQFQSFSPGLVTAIGEQQNQILGLDQQLREQQQQQLEFQLQLSHQQQNLERLAEQLQEQTLVLSELQHWQTAQPEVVQSETTPIEADETPLAKEPAKTSQLPDSQTAKKLAELQQQTEQSINDLRAQLTELASHSRQQVTDYVESEQWQQDKHTLQQQLAELETSLENLAKTQVEWIEKIKPQLEQIAEEIQPQLDGLFSRFNQIFKIKKHPDPVEKDTPNETDAEVQP